MIMLFTLPGKSNATQGWLWGFYTVWHMVHSLLGSHTVHGPTENRINQEKFSKLPARFQSVFCIKIVLIDL